MPGRYDKRWKFRRRPILAGGMVFVLIWLSACGREPDTAFSPPATTDSSLSASDQVNVEETDPVQGTTPFPETGVATASLAQTPFPPSLLPTDTPSPSLTPTEPGALTVLAPIPTLSLSPVPTVSQPITTVDRNIEGSEESSVESTGQDPTVSHTVVSGETLSGIALRYNTSVSAIQSANGLTDDRIFPEQVLVIPNSYAAPPATPVTVPTAAPVAASEPITTAQPAAPSPDEEAAPIKRFSILQGDLGSAYPASLQTERFALHHAPDMIPDREAEALANSVSAALLHHERLLNTRLAGPFDVYAAGSLFAAPNQALRGRSFSSERRFFFLADGTGNAADLQYIIAHELTHTFTWNAWGAPSSVMVHEGVAVYAGMDFIASSDHMPIDQFCAAYAQTETLPRVSTELTYQGHIRDLENYYAAGCFVEYVIEQYGPDAFAQLYPSGNYSGIYGKSLSELEAEWRTYLAASPTEVPFDPYIYVNLVKDVKAAYARLFSNFAGTSAQMAAYYDLNAARIALLEGEIETVQQYLAQQ